MERMQGAKEEDHQKRELTDKDRVNIQDSWAKVYQNCDDVGVDILIRLFVTNPSSKQYFKFKNVEDTDELKKSTQLRNHARRVMNRINTLVENLENPDKVVTLLEELGRAHARRHKVEPKYFQVLNGVILEVLGKEFPDAVIVAWTKLLNVLYVTITATYEKEGWPKLST
ncbi:cytoglobin-1-like [Festucalex cinctus]